jgi:CTP synthase
MTKFIFVTGGVLSGLGKGIAAASIGHLLQKYKVIPVKCDGYLNVDPGTMNPYEHGEVFVLDDGGEVDMDFGHYERFLNVSTKKGWNLTMGKVYSKVREKERRGDYLGKTVQYVPHVTNLIVDWWKFIANKEKADVLMIEIGGTVGDIETDLYIEAARQLGRELKKNDRLFVHLTYVPVPYGVNEQKSKPTQQSVNLLRSKGINPDMVIGRCEEILTPEIKRKIALFADMDESAVITGLDVDNIYKIPLIFNNEKLPRIIEKKLKLKVKPDLSRLRDLITNMSTAKREVTVAIAGKYTKLEDSYASILEALNHCSANLQAKIQVKWIETSEGSDLHSELEGVDAVIVPGGFGTRGIEGKIKVINFCRENEVPFLGICYGLQLAIVEYARNVCGLEGANTEEAIPELKHNVVCILPEQKAIKEKGGTMRLGSYPAKLKKGTLIKRLYGREVVNERHRHRYEVNPEYHKLLQDKGLEISGMSPNGKLAEFIELPEHPYFVATQAHPELKSNLFRPAPLFLGLVAAAVQRKFYKTSTYPAAYDNKK